MLKYLSLFLIAALSLTLTALAPLGRPGLDVNVQAERTKPYPSLSPPSRGGWGGSPAGASPFQHGGSPPCYALQNPTVRIDPVETVVGTGEMFTVAVMIDNANDLGGFEFNLFFHTATVRADSVTLGDFLGSTGRNVMPVGPTIDNQAGRVGFGAFSFAVGSVPGPNGTGLLATITFTAQSYGESPLDLQDVLVLDTHAQRQTATVEDGTVVVGSTPTPTTTPTSTPTATPTSSKIYLPLVLKGW